MEVKAVTEPWWQSHEQVSKTGGRILVPHDTPAEEHRTILAASGAVSVEVGLFPLADGSKERLGDQQDSVEHPARRRATLIEEGSPRW